MYQSEESSKLIQRKVLQTESEYEKDKALLTQKIEHLEQTLD